MIARYIPCMMCISTGGVPQCTMNAPGSPRHELELQLLAGADRPERHVHRDRAEWKSMECGIGLSFTSVTFTRSPCRTRIVGPGTVLPNVQPSYFTPGAISISGASSESGTPAP
jgi:hypothetical protein